MDVQSHNGCNFATIMFKMLANKIKNTGLEK